MSLIYTSPTSRHNLYLGGKVDAKSLSTLQQRNVRRILNVTPAKEAGIVSGVPNYFENTSSTIKYKRISVYDASTSDLLPYSDEIVQFISNGLHHGSVLVHCQRGVSRSATSVIMFLMRKANMTLQQSLKVCQRRRPMVDPNPGFLDQLRTYERECRAGGHLTSVDNQLDNVKAKEKEIVEGGAVKKVSEKNGRVRDDTCSSADGEKRKAENSDCGDGKKKRTVGPIGPPRGPMKSAAIGPMKSAAIGPMKSAAIGPVMRPPTKASSEKIKSGRGNDDGGKPEGADGMVQVEERKDEKRVVGPMNRPPPIR